MTRYPHDVLAWLRRVSVVILFGIYTVGVAASLYFLASRRFVTDGHAPVHLVDQGGLEVRTRPDDVVVRLDGASIGTTPIADPELTPGTAQISFELEGYEPWRGTVSLPSREFLDAGTIAMVPKLAARTSLAVEPGISYLIPGDRPIVAHVPLSRDALMILDSGELVQSLRDITVDSVAAHPEGDSLALVGKRGPHRTVIVVEQGAMGVRIREIGLDADAVLPDRFVPVRYATTTDSLLAFTPDYGLSVGDAEVVRHELWPGRLVAWGVPGGTWSALAEDGTLIRLMFGVINRADSFGTVPKTGEGSAVIRVTHAAVLLHSREGSVIRLDRVRGPTRLMDDVVDTDDTDEGLLLAVDGALALLDDNDTIRARLAIAGDPVESIIGVTGEGLVIYETKAEVRAVPLAAIRHPELTLSPVSLARLGPDERVFGLSAETLVLGSADRITWQSVVATEDPTNR